jgi:hypothetical protein
MILVVTGQPHDLRSDRMLQASFMLRAPHKG